MKLAVCIPNFNYERYLGRTIRSVLDQESGGTEIEVLIADNASTDRSVAVIEEFRDPRVRVTVNACNVGFANNLDRAARMARGDRMILLSSDDLMRPGAVNVYTALAAACGESAAVFSSTMDMIDADDKITGRIGPDTELWLPEDIDAGLSNLVHATVYRAPARTLLKRSISAMKNPLSFAATCFRRADYQAIEGYGGGRLINPDKWFHWRLLSCVDHAIWVDAPLFAYRWHASNQTAQQQAQGALKYLVDEYAMTLELDGKLLDAIGFQRADVERAFIERDVARHGLATLAKGDRAKARRILDFGRAVFPQHVKRNSKARVLAALLGADVLGQQVARVGHLLWERRRNVGPR